MWRMFQRQPRTRERMTKCLRTMLSDTSGGTLVEYALIIALIAAVAVLAVSTLGRNNSSILNSAANSI